MRIVYIVAFIIIATLSLAIVWAASGIHPAQGQECVNVEQDKAHAEALGMQWLGVFNPPVGNVPGAGFAFYRKGDMLVFSVIVDGCVSPAMTPLGRLAVERPAVNGTPA